MKVTFYILTVEVTEEGGDKFDALCYGNNGVTVFCSSSREEAERYLKSLARASGSSEDAYTIHEL